MGHFDIYAHNSALLVIDIQEAFLPIIPQIQESAACGKNASILIQGAKLLDIPITISEQYAKGLGHTLSYLSDLAPQAQVFDKKHFSCSDDQALKQHFADSQKDNIIICGIEAHICVLSTAADLINHGYNVIIAGDACASRNELNKDMALDALRSLGAVVVPTESIVMRLQRQAGHGCFKELSKLIR